MEHVLNPHKRFGLAAIAIIALLAVVSGASACSSKAYSGEIQSVTFANLHLASSALVYIAEDQQYFSKNGLAVTLKEFDTGTATGDAVLKGQADMAAMSESVMVGDVLQKQKASILGVMDKTMTINLIGLTNRGISKTSDLAGKRIGLGRKTSSEFYLGRFLELNGMNIKDVVMVDTPPTKLLDALSSGDVDAVVGWAPYTTQIQQRFANGTVTWPVQSDQPVFGLIVSNNDWISSHPETITRFWKSLAQAEDFINRHPDETKTIIEKKLSLDKTFIDSVWSQYTFSLSLDRSLVVAMEDEARWMINNNLTTEQAVPDFLNYIYPNGLKAVKPEAVNISK